MKSNTKYVPKVEEDDNDDVDDNDEIKDNDNTEE